MFWDKSTRKTADRATIEAALGNPDWLVDLVIKPEGVVTLILLADPSDLEQSETRRIEAETRVGNLAGVTQVKSVLTAEAAPGAHRPEPAPLPGMHRVKKGARLSDAAISQGQPDTTSQIAPIPGIERILVVASAKGGVGKSTVAVNLAAAFARQGLKTGLLDADVYGPSIPTMLGQDNASPTTNSDGKLIPVEAFGLQTLSIGYLTDADAPMIWRGPIVQSAITQMLNDAAWGTPDDPLDLLIIDTPPGTGEAQLTLAQKVPVSAAIIVTTPQEVALADVRRGAAMFAKMHVPVLGIVETMSWFEDPAGGKHFIMGEGGGNAMARALGLPLLCQIPMLQAIREGGDAGQPAVLGDDKVSGLFQDLARTTALNLDNLQTKPAPKIIFED